MKVDQVTEIATRLVIARMSNSSVEMPASEVDADAFANLAVRLIHAAEKKVVEVNNDKIRGMKFKTGDKIKVIKEGQFFGKTGRIDSVKYDDGYYVVVLDDLCFKLAPFQYVSPEWLEAL